MENKKYLIVWNQENRYGYNTLPREYTNMQIWAPTEEDAVEKATVKIMHLVRNQLGDVEVKTNDTSTGNEILVHKEKSHEYVARIFDIHSYMTI